MTSPSIDKATTLRFKYYASRKASKFRLLADFPDSSFECPESKYSAYRQQVSERLSNFKRSSSGARSKISIDVLFSIIPYLPVVLPDSDKGNNNKKRPNRSAIAKFMRCSMLTYLMVTENPAVTVPNTDFRSSQPGIYLDIFEERTWVFGPHPSWHCQSYCASGRLEGLFEFKCDAEIEARWSGDIAGVLTPVQTHSESQVVPHPTCKNSFSFKFKPTRVRGPMCTYEVLAFQSDVDGAKLLPDVSNFLKTGKLTFAVGVIKSLLINETSKIPSGTELKGVKIRIPVVSDALQSYGADLGRVYPMLAKDSKSGTFELCWSLSHNDIFETPLQNAVFEVKPLLSEATTPATAGLLRTTSVKKLHDGRHHNVVVISIEYSSGLSRIGEDSKKCGLVITRCNILNSKTANPAKWLRCTNTKEVFEYLL
eukprot:PhM_4_TR5948/c0_g1_i2/m.1039